MSLRQTQELNTVYSVASLCSASTCLVDFERQRGYIILQKTMLCREDAEALLLFTHHHFNKKTRGWTHRGFLVSHRAHGGGEPEATSSFTG